MSLGSLLFGDRGGPSREYQDALRGLDTDYLAALEQEFGPGAFQRRLAQFSEGFDRSLANSGAASGRTMNQRGFAGATPNLGLIRSSAMGNARMQIQNDMDMRRRQAILQRLGILGQLGQATYRQPSSGLLPSIAGAFGQAAGYGKQAQQPGGNDMGRDGQGDFGGNYPGITGGYTNPIDASPGLNYSMAPAPQTAYGSLGLKKPKSYGLNYR